MLNYEAALQVLANQNLPGWQKLITRFYDQLPPSVEVEALYQKWGGLHIDIYPDHPEVARLIDQLEQESRSLCERCGELAKEVQKNGGTHTLCDFHANL